MILERERPAAGPETRRTSLGHRDDIQGLRAVAVLLVALGHAGIRAAFIDTIGWFCFENQCPMVVGHAITYRDNYHISTTYALELRQLFRDAFTQALAA